MSITHRYARLSDSAKPLFDQPQMSAMKRRRDLFTQGGLLAVLCFAWISATAFLQTYRARLAGLTTMLCGIMVFGVANLIVRQPLFWFGIALCLTSGTARWQSGNKAKITVLGNGSRFGNA